jgi:hypothetical protein
MDGDWKLVEGRIGSVCACGSGLGGPSFSGFGVAMGSESPEAVNDAGDDHTAKGPEQRSGPFVLGSRPQVNNGAAIGCAKPGDEGVAQGACDGENDEKAIPGNSKSAGCEQKGGERNGRRQDCREKDGEDRVALHPCGDAGATAFGNVAAHGGFPTFFAELPGGVTANDAADDRAAGEQPRVSTLYHEEQKKQVSGARDRKGNDGGVDNGDEEESHRAEVDDPARDQGVMGMADGRGGKDAHQDLDVHLRLQAARLSKR